MSYKVTIALAKGRLADDTLKILQRCGIEYKKDDDDRKLVAYDTTGQFRFLFVKPSDVPTYVSRGTADLGVVGKDTLMEEGKDLYELVDLKFGKCRLCIAAEVGKKFDNTDNLRVGTKYSNIAKKYYNSKGINADIIKLNGSVELAPITNLSDVILDIVESGKTLKSNGLEVIEEIAYISARLTVNKVSYKTKYDIIFPLVEKIKAIIEETND